MMDSTSMELLKSYGDRRTAGLIDVEEVLRTFFAEKGYGPRVIRKIAETNGALRALISQLLLRANGEGIELFDYLARSAKADQMRPTEAYRGLPEQNLRIDRALATSGALRGPKDFVGEGAATIFAPNARAIFIDDRARRVPIVVIGYGAAGILVSNVLRYFGFQNVQVAERARPRGIWSQKNVVNGSRNNPRFLQYFDVELAPAPGDGIEVEEFLRRLSAFKPEKANISGVQPGNLRHVLKFAHSERTVEVPIVINTMGTGKPKPLSDPKRMVTGATSSIAGPRWQQQLSRDDVESKRLVFIGLGNSTAEMLRQVHTFMDEGVEVDYRVLTHYPKDAVFNPDETVEMEGRQFRVFRDLTRPNLVDFQGDLPASRFDYFRALRTGRIVSDVRQWDVDASCTKLRAASGHGASVTEFSYDRIWTLTGYAHTPETVSAMGCTYDDEHRCARYDFDGEFIADPNAVDPDKRLYKGYFGFGAVLESPFNPNAIVIPGMLYRLGDLVFGIVMRATEYAERQNS